MQAKRTKYKRKCHPCEIYCVRCKSPQHPAENMVEYEPINNLKGRLIAICPACSSIMNKFTSVTKLAQIQGKLDITILNKVERINESVKPILNSDFK